MFDGIAALFKFMAIALVVSIPLAIWKLVEIIIWLVHHVHVSF